MIIGISGTFGSGKDTIARLFEERGFQHESTSDILRDKLRENKIPLTQPNLHHFSNVFAKELGGEFLSKAAVGRKKDKDLVVSGVRSPGDVKYLKSLSDSFLLFVNAPIEVRYKRIVDRAREGENKISFSEFKTREEREIKGFDVQNITFCKESADYLIENSGSLNEAEKKVEDILTKLRK